MKLSFDLINPPKHSMTTNTYYVMFIFSFESSDGTSRQEFGHLLLPGTEDEHMKVNGSYSYLGPDGVFYEVRYTADDQGFHPEGDHINVPPFVPWIHRHVQQTEQDYHIPEHGLPQNILNTIGSTPTPTTQYLPAFSSREDIHNIFSTTPRPTTQYLPQASNKPGYGYVTRESIVNSYKPSSTTYTNPFSSTSTSSPISSSSFTSLDPEIIIFSTPKPHIQD